VGEIWSLTYPSPFSDISRRRRNRIPHLLAPPPFTDMSRRGRNLIPHLPLSLFWYMSRLGRNRIPYLLTPPPFTDMSLLWRNRNPHSPLLICLGVGDLKKPHYVPFNENGDFETMKVFLKCFVWYIRAIQYDEKDHYHIYYIIIYSWYKFTCIWPVIWFPQISQCHNISVERTMCERPYFIVSKKITLNDGYEIVDDAYHWILLHWKCNHSKMR
jgi:hypothetical protein